MLFPTVILQVNWEIISHVFSLGCDCDHSAKSKLAKKVRKSEIMKMISVTMRQFLWLFSKGHVLGKSPHPTLPITLYRQKSKSILRGVVKLSLPAK